MLRPQLLGAALHAAAALEQLPEVHRDRLEAALAQRVQQPGGALREQDVPAVGHRVQAEGGRVGGVGDQRVREEPLEHLPAAGREAPG